MKYSVWLYSHAAALRDYVAEGKLSYAEIARAINSNFNTTFTRNATIGRAKRMGLVTAQERKPISKERSPRIRHPRVLRPLNPNQPKAKLVFSAPELRVIDLAPRAPNITIIDIGKGECRWPVSEAAGIHYFCGHPSATAIDESGHTVTHSYCGFHRHISTGRGTSSERAALRGVAA